MRKSIYFLLANLFSTIGAFIYISILNSTLVRVYPYYGFNLTVFATANAFEPFKYLLLILAASIIFCAQDCVAASNNPGKPVPGEKVSGIVGTVITILALAYTWTTVLLLRGQYATGATIQLPIWFLCCYIGGLLMMFLERVISKKDANIGAFFVLGGMLLMVSGFLCEIFFADYWWIVFCTFPVVIVSIGVPALIFSLLGKKKN